MGFRFRKSINIGGFRINLSKTGIGYSFGFPGMRVTKLANGRNKLTFSIPGTGISHVTETKGNYNENNANDSYEYKNNINCRLKDERLD